jgi:hypothetical protein
MPIREKQRRIKSRRFRHGQIFSAPPVIPSSAHFTGFEAPGNFDTKMILREIKILPEIFLPSD